MTYHEAIVYLYTATAVFQHDGPSAYKPGLERVEALASMFGNPHLRFPTIHVGGTNGKGSTAHTLAAVLQSAGYKVGLFTSPHLVDFRERIRVDGAMIPKDTVARFVEEWLAGGDQSIAPSFFELTTMMAFDYFAAEKVDVAVIEVGLGGRLDSTNIITPRLSVITNISLDHTALLGDSAAAIAAEKAGIIKPGVPVVIGEAEGEVREVFSRRAAEVAAPIVFAQDWRPFADVEGTKGEKEIYPNTPFGDIAGELTGECQRLNAATVMTALLALRAQGWSIPDSAVKRGFASVTELTGLQGRWMVVSRRPLVVCDTGHNVGGWQYLAPKLAAYGDRLKMVIGFVSDKDVSHILEMMPREAQYYFTQATVNRALPAADLARLAATYSLRGRCYPSVEEAFAAARSTATPDSAIFIGGSNFIVGDFLTTAPTH